MWNIDELLERIWEYLGLIRLYTKPKARLFPAPATQRRPYCAFLSSSSAPAPALLHRTLRAAAVRFPQLRECKRSNSVRTASKQLPNDFQTASKQRPNSV